MCARLDSLPARPRGESVDADQELFVIANLEEVWVDFQVPLSDARSLQKGQKVRVGSSTGSSSQAEATIRYVAPMANEMSRTVAARATLCSTQHSQRAARTHTHYTACVRP